MHHLMFQKRPLAAAIHLLLAVSCGAAVVMVGNAHAQQAATIQASAMHQVDIPAGSLTAALNIFANEVGVALSFDPQLTAGLASGGLVARVSVQQGFARLLAGSGLEAVDSGKGAYALRRVVSAQPVGVLPEVRVTGAEESATGPVRGYVAKRSATASKTDTPLLEIPQSISVVTADQIRDQGAQSIEQSLNYTAGTVVGSNGPSTEHDYVFSRGFTSRQFLDGGGLYASYISGAQLRIEPFGLERVEVLRGPSSGLYGQIEPGGLVNMISKRPTAGPLREVGVQFGTFGHRQATLDLGGALTEDGRFSYRLTALVRDADTQSDYMENNRRFIAPAITWRPSSDTTLTLLAHYQTDTGGGRAQPLPPEGTLLPNPHGRVPLDRFLGEPGFDGMEREQSAVGYVLEHRFNDAVQFRQNLRHARARFDERFSLVDYYGASWSGDLRTVDRYAWDDRNALTLDSLDNQLEMDFETGAARHKLLVGLDYKRVKDQWDFYSADESTLDVFNPVYGTPIGPFTQGISELTTRRQLGLYLQDQIYFGNWIAIVGLRRDQAKGRTADLLYGTETQLDDKKTTGRLGLTYLFGNGMATYASVSTSFDPVSGADGEGQPFKPTTGRQAEVGFKYQPADSNSLFTAALFDLTQRNVLTRDPNPPASNPWAQIQTGEIQVRGAEFEAKTQLTQNLRVLASYTYLDSEITRSNGDDLGREKAYVPKHAASVWGDYRFTEGALSGWEVGAGLRYRAAVWGLGYDFRIPSFTLVDLAMRYRLSPRAVLALNIRNAGDRKHVTNCSYADGCIYGDRRTAVLSLNYGW